MNERIKELEKQCWSHRVDGTLVDGQLHFDTKKFAELIVRECAKRVDYWESRQGEHADDLLKHFGVQE